MKYIHFLTLSDVYHSFPVELHLQYSTKLPPFVLYRIMDNVRPQVFCDPTTTCYSMQYLPSYRIWLAYEQSR